MRKLHRVERREPLEGTVGKNLTASTRELLHDGVWAHPAGNAFYRLCARSSGAICF